MLLSVVHLFAPSAVVRADLDGGRGVDAHGLLRMVADKWGQH